jgi:hypothetical protein
VIKDKCLNKTVLAFIFSTVQIITLYAQELETLQNLISVKNNSNLTSEKQQSYRIKTKKYSNGLTSVKLYLKNSMLTKQEAKSQNISQNFIKSIRLLEKGIVVYNATLTPYVAQYPILKFKYYGSNASILRLETIDNNNKIIRQDTAFEKISGLLELSTVKQANEKSQSIKIANHDIQKLFGKRNFIKSKNIKISAPDITPNPFAVNVKIQSNIKAKSVALFATESDHKASYFDIKNSTITFDDKNLVLVYHSFLQKKSIIDFQIKLNHYALKVHRLSITD